MTSQNNKKTINSYKPKKGIAINKLLLQQTTVMKKNKLSLNGLKTIKFIY